MENIRTPDGDDKVSHVNLKFFGGCLNCYVHEEDASSVLPLGPAFLTRQTSTTLLKRRASEKSSEKVRQTHSFPYTDISILTSGHRNKNPDTDEKICTQHSPRKTHLLTDIYIYIFLNFSCPKKLR